MSGTKRGYCGRRISERASLALGLSVSAEAVRQRSKKEGWNRGEKPSLENNKPSLENKKTKLGQSIKKQVLNKPQEIELALSGDRESQGSGRKTLYREAYNRIAYDTCLMGADDSIVAEVLNISEATLYDWKIKYPKFLESIRKGKIYADAKVASALYKSALGGEWVEEEKIVQNESGHEIVTVRKQVPANVTAQKFWLTNRQKDKWKNKVDSDVEMAINETSIDHLKNLSAVMEKAHERQRLLRIERGID